MKRSWVLGIWALLALPCSAQQIMYSNLKELVEDRGDTVTILKVEKRSKNQIYLMGGADYRIEAEDNSGLCRYLKSRCYAVRIDTSLYVNCRKMRYKRYRFGGWYAPAMWVKGKIYYCAAICGPLPRALPLRLTRRSWAVKWGMPSMPRGWYSRACTMN